MAQPPPPRPELEREVWLACAGPYARLPDTGSRVYYFPRGHADQCLGAGHPFVPVVTKDAAFPCTVSAVELFYHADTDDPYAIITLLPNDGQGQAQAQPSDHQINPTDDSKSAAYFVKQLPYDEAFVVPKACAESLHLSFNHNKEKQTLDLLDVHRRELQFGLSGDGRLTTGWDQYLRDKELNHMDAVVFIRSANGQLIIGWRRGTLCRYHASEQIQDVKKASTAARVAGGPFRVTYYPRQGWDFVRPREEVDAANARNIDWRPGMKVRMVCPVDDHELESSRAQRRNSYEGIVAAVKNKYSTWCKLEINWQISWWSPSPESKVPAWRVELQRDPSPTNKRKMSQSHDFDADHPSSKSNVPCQMPGATTAQYMAGSPIAAGVQGGRQVSIPDALSSSCTPTSETLFGEEIAPTSGVPTQNIASSSIARSIRLFSVKMASGVAPVDATPKDDSPAKNPPAKDDDQNPDESA
ncbi:auxin response factor 13-like [Brachypodium distachyon]|uniref:TF-B3 domain-containing protein n=1 Tax=Brachypodium distachyon TaxID=15368 RepID=A0A2K2DJ58_BRADI|nr:auxin response factor 13-like [Brachypodium distachyon]PNT74313.1 hypothetical protein BRADI_1g12477v3 [Brachypodium distachyon]|eukprot:XP_010229512.1 auxin response factor 13-like [Brachypodium distachyon]